MTSGHFISLPGGAADWIEPEEILANPRRGRPQIPTEDRRKIYMREYMRRYMAKRRAEKKAQANARP